MHPRTSAGSPREGSRQPLHLVPDNRFLGLSLLGPQSPPRWFGPKCRRPVSTPARGSLSTKASMLQTCSELRLLHPSFWGLGAGLSLCTLQSRFRDMGISVMSFALRMRKQLLRSVGRLRRLSSQHHPWDRRIESGRTRSTPRAISRSASLAASARSEHPRTRLKTFGPHLDEEQLAEAASASDRRNVSSWSCEPPREPPAHGVAGAPREELHACEKNRLRRGEWWCSETQ